MMTVRIYIFSSISMCRENEQINMDLEMESEIVKVINQQVRKTKRQTYTLE